MLKRRQDHGDRHSSSDVEIRSVCRRQDSNDKRGHIPHLGKLGRYAVFDIQVSKEVIIA